MNEHCGIVRDLLPLYHDNVCSAESRALVEEHLKTCEECTAELDCIDKEFAKPRDFKKAEQAAVDSFKRFRSKILHKNVVIGLVTFVCAIGLFAGVYWVVFGHETVASYHEGIVTVDSKADGTVNVNYNDGRYAGLFVIEKRIEEDGVLHSAYYLNFTETFYTRHFEKEADGEQTQFNLGEPITLYMEDGFKMKVEGDELGDSVEIDASDVERYFELTEVYYIERSTQKLASLSDEEFAKATEDAVLIWEKTK
jgi:hypothetical protein